MSIEETVKRIVKEEVTQLIEEPITQKEIATKLKTTRQHIASLRQDNKIPFIQVGHRYLFQLSKVITALEVQPSVYK